MGRGKPNIAPAGVSPKHKIRTFDKGTKIKK